MPAVSLSHSHLSVLISRLLWSPLELPIPISLPISVFLEERLNEVAIWVILNF